MRPAQWLIAAVLLMVGACGGGSPSEEAAPAPEAVRSANIAAPEAAADNLQNLAAPPADVAETVEVPDDPGAAGLSPSQRRAYDRGFRDCSAGRYAPDLYSEAYRIGCAAAQDR